MFDCLRLPLAILAWAFAIGGAVCIALVTAGIVAALIDRDRKDKK